MNHFRPLALFLVCIWTLLPRHAHADTLTVSPRVGTVIDTTNRIYFRLFPKVKSFQHAVFMESGESGSVAVLVNDTAFTTLSPLLFSLLRDYIRDYDSLRYGLRDGIRLQELNRKFTPLHVLGVVAEFEDFQGVSIVVHTGRMNGSDTLQYSGNLLWADEERVLIASNERSAAVEPWSIEAADILFVRIYKKSSSGGVISGALIGGATLGLVTLLHATQTSTGQRSWTNTTDPGLIALYTTYAAVVGAIAGAVVGAIFASIVPLAEQTYIESPSDYLGVLPELQKQSYYRFGLPPEMR